MASKGTQKNRAASGRVIDAVAKAELAVYNQSPRKTRLVTDLVKGKTVREAIVALSFLPKRASLPIQKLIQSAAANSGLSKDEQGTLKIEDIRVDSAGMLVRFMPRAMGRAAPIRKRRSRIQIALTSAPAAK